MQLIHMATAFRAPILSRFSPFGGRYLQDQRMDECRFLPLFGGTVEQGA
jgi:hypothetical protein